MIALAPLYLQRERMSFVKMIESKLPIVIRNFKTNYNSVKFEVNQKQKKTRFVYQSKINNSNN